MNTDASATIASPARLATLSAIGLLDSPREQSYDRLTRLATAALRAPVTLITLIDSDRQFFKSSVGLPEPWASSRVSPLEYSLCQHVVETGQALTVEDARVDPLVKDSRAVSEMGLVAYAGVPLRTVEGQVIGAFAAADRVPHHWEPSDVALLEDFGAATMHEIEVHGALRAAVRQAAAVSESADEHGGFAQFRGIVDASPVGVGVMQDGLLQFVNGEFAAIFGYDDEELLAGASMFDLVTEVERSVVKTVLEHALSDTEQRFCHEFTGLRKDGAVVDVELRGTRWQVADRPALVCSLSDISARKASDEQLRRSEEQLRALTMNTWDVVHMLSPEDVILYITPSVERVLGFRPEEMIGQHSDQYVHPDDLPHAREAFAQDIKCPGARRRLELRLRHKSGEWRDVEVVGQIVADSSGAPIAIVNTHDVTEQKRVDRELRQQSASVELLEYVAAASNEAASMDDAVQPCLQRICEHNDWRAAHLCLRDGKGNLVSTGHWYLGSNPDRFAAFREGTDAEVFAPGVGLPGRVLQTGKSAWIPDVTEDPTFIRQHEAVATGIKGGIACPLLVGTEVVGALEFFADRVLAVDEPLMEILGHVGTQLGRVVEREQAHEAMLKSEGRIRSIVELAHDAFVATDMGGIITEWNTQAEAIFGWSRDEALGRSMADSIIPARHRAAHRRGLRHFTRKGKSGIHSRRMEIEALHRDGHEFPVELSITAIPIDDGWMFTSFLHDITARKQAEEKLRCSEERYDLVARATSDVVWDWNVVTGVLTWNKAIQRTCRYQADQIGSTMEWWYNHIHPSDRERVVTGTHAALNGTREFWTDEYRFQRGDGTYATVLARGHVVRNDRGEAVRMIGSMVDITERKLEEQGQRFIAQAGALLDTSLDQEVILSSLARLAVPTLADYCLIDVLDERGNLHRAAMAHADPSKEALLHEIEHNSPEGDEEQDLVLKVVRTRQPVLIRESGEQLLRTLRVSAKHREALRTLAVRSLMIVPLLTREQILGAITFGLGDSGRHYDLMDLLTAEQLAQRAARTIDNGRLYDNAQRAIRARDEVVAVVSHDLRNPLSTISLSASLLLDEGTQQRANSANLLDVIKRSADQANVMIKNLLDVSSIEAGHFAVKRGQELVAELVQHACAMIAPLAERKSIHLQCESPPVPLVVSADGNQINRVLSNLIGNAVKFTPAGGSISVRVEEASNELRFAVTDSGPGIAAEHLPHVFDRFWQARKGDRHGAGLGLSIVRGIVEAHGGRTWVESTLGEGSTFFFTLPLPHHPTEEPELPDGNIDEETGEHMVAAG